MLTGDTNYLADAVLWEVPAGSENFPWYMINDAAVLPDSYSKVVTIFFRPCYILVLRN